MAGLEALTGEEFADGKRRSAAVHQEFGTANMFANHTDLDHRTRRTPEEPFRSRPLLPRDRRRHRRQPQRRDRQTLPPRPDARQDHWRTACASAGEGAQRRNPFRALQYQMLQVVYENGAAGRRRADRQRAAAARCSNSARSDAAGRSARPARRIFAFAATRRSRACPIAPATPASPTSPARAQRVVRGCGV